MSPFGGRHPSWESCITISPITAIRRGLNFFQVKVSFIYFINSIFNIVERDAQSCGPLTKAGGPGVKEDEWDSCFIGFFVCLFACFVLFTFTGFLKNFVDPGH